MTTVPSSPIDRQKIKGMLTEITHCLQKIDDQKEGKKEIVNELKRQFGLDRKQINKLATTLYKRNYVDIQAENEDFEELYTTLVETQSTVDAEAE